MKPSEQIDKQIADAPGWQGATLSRLRQLIHEADPEVREEWKWSTAVFSHDGMVCALGAFKDHVKVNFFKGAALADPHGLINAGLESKATRAIDIFEGNVLDERGLIDLVKEAVDLNVKKESS
jgi:hypothetical protein